MGDPLSTISAVASLADIVFRTCTKLYEFLSNLQDVPAEVKHLSNSLRTWKAVSQAVKDTISRYVRSQFDTEDNLPLTAVFEALKSCEIAFASINVLITGHRSGSSSKRVKFIKDVKWIFDEKKIQSAQQNLDRSKLALTTALTTISRSVTGLERYFIARFSALTITQPK